MGDRGSQDEDNTKTVTMLTDHAETETQNNVRIEGQDHVKLKSRQILMTTTLESSYWVKQIPLNPDLCILPLLEVPIQDSTGETLPTDPDSFQHTVTTELVDNQMVLHDA